MKKIILLTAIIMSAVIADAREPYGNYICRYIYNHYTGEMQSSYIPIRLHIKVFKQKIQMQGLKFGNLHTKVE